MIIRAGSYAVSFWDSFLLYLALHELRDPGKTVMPLVLSLACVLKRPLNPKGLLSM